MTRWGRVAAGLLLLGLTACKTTETPATTTSQPTGSEFQESAVSAADRDHPTTASMDTVYFEHDQYVIQPQALETLKLNAVSITQNTEWGTVVIEGHCDERGSEEYNVSLGDRRAAQVKRYLVDLGVPSERLKTVSYGEARPAVAGVGESAWRYNRRSEFKVGMN
jgi:peptidoglycan-associated lipoprotein